MNRGTRGVNRQKLPGRRLIGLAILALASIVIACVVLLLSFPNALLRGFVESHMTEGFAASYAGYSIRLSGLRFEMMKNRIECDTVVFVRNDSSFTCSIAPLSVSGVHWLELLRGVSFDPRSLSGSVIEAGDVDAALQPSGYRIRTGPLRISVPDSEITIESVEILPSAGDERFFGESKTRKTRIDFSARSCTLSGLSCVDMFRGDRIQARSIRFQDVSADILINKDKPSGTDPPGPRMPNEFLAAMKDTVGCDSLLVTGGTLRYSERMLTGRKPATLAIDGLHMLATGIASHSARSADADVQVTGKFAGGGTMDVVMTIPVGEKQCSFRYSGSLTGMDLSRLNSFIEVSDDMRIKTGTLESAAFDINVNSGSATGNVRAAYRDLVIASIDARTGSEGGILDRFSSWIARNIKIRRTNEPDRSGAMKIGKVKYSRKRADPFLGFAWFALRSGVGDVVGF